MSNTFHSGKKRAEVRKVTLSKHQGAQASLKVSVKVDGEVRKRQRSRERVKGARLEAFPGRRFSYREGSFPCSASENRNPTQATNSQVRRILWHRIVAFFGRSEKYNWRVPTNLTWSQFDATYKIECKDGTEIEKHRYEVDHLWGHDKSLVDAMAIIHHKDHRKQPHPGRGFYYK